MDGTFSSRLGASQDARGVKGRWLARQVGVTEATYCRWRRGGSVPGLGHAVRLAELLGVDVVWLLRGEEAGAGR